VNRSVEKPAIALVDYGGGNLRSVEMALASVGANVRMTGDPAWIEQADGIVSPGQGAFGDVMGALERCGLRDVVRRRAQEARDGGRPFFGICVGMQYMVEGSEEEPGVAGMGLFTGRCKRLRPEDPSLKVPHMGWNQLIFRPGDGARLFAGLPDRAYVYFVHSFYPDPEDKSVWAAETEYGVRFCSALAKRNLFATQFHPEKSQQTGLKILRNFVELVERSARERAGA